MNGITAEELSKSLDDLHELAGFQKSEDKQPTDVPKTTKEANGGLQDYIDGELPEELNVTKGMDSDGDDDDYGGEGDGDDDDDEDGDEEMPEDEDRAMKSFKAIAKSQDRDFYDVEGWLKTALSSLTKSNDSVVKGTVALGQHTTSGMVALQSQIQVLAKGLIAANSALQTVIQNQAQLMGLPQQAPQQQFTPQPVQPMQSQAPGPWNPHMADGGAGFQKSFNGPSALPQTQVQPSPMQAPSNGAGYDPGRVLKALTDLSMHQRIDPSEVAIYETGVQDMGAGQLTEATQGLVHQYFQNGGRVV